MPTCTVTYWSRAWSPPFGDWAAGQYSNMITTPALLKKLKVWPSISPDLSPIEHLWGILKLKVEERKVSNIHQLCDVVMEVWKRTPVATCEALVNSMPKRVKACWKIMVATQNIDTLGCTHFWRLYTLMAECWVILRGQQIYTVIQAVHSLLYIEAKCHFFSVVTWKYIRYLQKCEECTHFCEILYIYSAQRKWVHPLWKVTF